MLRSPVAIGWRYRTKRLQSFCAVLPSPVSRFLAAGMLICDYELKLGWGKAVPLPAQALPAPPAGASAQSMLAGVRH